MNVRPEDLAGHLERKLAPLYVVHGDEPLLALEAADQVRAAARRSGIVERDVLVVEQGFKWGAFLAAQSNLGRSRVERKVRSGDRHTAVLYRPQWMDRDDPGRHARGHRRELAET